jgi:hypothetical protein
MSIEILNRLKLKYQLRKKQLERIVNVIQEHSDIPGDNLDNSFLKIDNELINMKEPEHTLVALSNKIALYEELLRDLDNDFHSNLTPNPTPIVFVPKEDAHGDSLRRIANSLVEQIKEEHIADINKSLQTFFGGFYVEAQPAGDIEIELENGDKKIICKYGATYQIVSLTLSDAEICLTLRGLEEHLLPISLFALCIPKPVFVAVKGNESEDVTIGRKKVKFKKGVVEVAVANHVQDKKSTYNYFIKINADWFLVDVRSIANFPIPKYPEFPNDGDDMVAYSESLDRYNKQLPNLENVAAYFQLLPNEFFVPKFHTINFSTIHHSTIFGRNPIYKSNKTE